MLECGWHAKQIWPNAGSKHFALWNTTWPHHTTLKQLQNTSCHGTLQRKVSLKMWSFGTNFQECSLPNKKSTQLHLFIHELSIGWQKLMTKFCMIVLIFSQVISLNWTNCPNLMHQMYQPFLRLSRVLWWNFKLWLTIARVCSENYPTIKHFGSEHKEETFGKFDCSGRHLVCNSTWSDATMFCESKLVH